MKICSPQLGLKENSVLGGEVFDREILIGLANKGVSVEVIVPKGNIQKSTIKNWNVTYLHFAHFPAILGNILYIPYLFKVFGKDKFSVIRIHQPQFLGIGCILFKLIKSNVKLIATYHQFNETKFGFLSNIINNYWDHIICDSENVKSLIAKNYKVDKSRISVVHNGAPKYLTPSSKDKVLESKLDLNNKFVLLYMGFFVNRKNPLFLLEVLEQVLKKNVNVSLIFIGKGPLESKLRLKVNEKKLTSKVIFIKPVFGNEKNKILNLADIFVHPSLDEGFALAPIEAMACAKPVIMSKGYSASEAITNNGFICQPNNVSDWSEKILKLANNKKLLKKLGINSLKTVKSDFNWNISVNKHLDIIKSLNA